MTIWFFLLKAIAGSIIGDASATWFKKTKFGVWFYTKVDVFYNWTAERYNFNILTAEEKQMQKFPQLKERLETIERQINEFRNRSRDTKKRDI